MHLIFDVSVPGLTQFQAQAYILKCETGRLGTPHTIHQYSKYRLLMPMMPKADQGERKGSCAYLFLEEEGRKVVCVCSLY
jgi:hypothetical protein